MMLSRRLLLSAALARALRAADDTGWIERLGGSVQRDAAGNVIAINLGDTWINDAEILDLLAFGNLVRLDLSHTRISDEGLLRLKPARQLEELNLLYAELITDLGLTAVRGWRRLKSLNVRGTRISDDTLLIVGELDQLESLDLVNTRITDNGLESLASLTRLKHLALGRTQITESAMEMLRLLATLESLDLGGPARNQRGRASGAMQESLVSAIAALPELRVLKLGYTDIDAHGLHNLSVLGKLGKLGLECCPRVDDKALMELAAWKSLRFLDVQETKVTQAGIEALQAAKPGIRILSSPFGAASSAG